MYVHVCVGEVNTVRGFLQVRWYGMPVRVRELHAPWEHGGGSTSVACCGRVCLGGGGGGLAWMLAWMLACACALFPAFHTHAALLLPICCFMATIWAAAKVVTKAEVKELLSARHEGAKVFQSYHGHCKIGKIGTKDQQDHHLRSQTTTEHVSAYMAGTCPDAAPAAARGAGGGCAPLAGGRHH